MEKISIYDLLTLLIAITGAYLAWKKAPRERKVLDTTAASQDAQASKDYAEAAQMTAAENQRLNVENSELKKILDTKDKEAQEKLDQLRAELMQQIDELRTQLQACQECIDTINKEKQAFEDWGKRLSAQIVSLGETPKPLYPKKRSKS